MIKNSINWNESYCNLKIIPKDRLRSLVSKYELWSWDCDVIYLRLLDILFLIEISIYFYCFFSIVRFNLLDIFFSFICIELSNLIFCMMKI
jgi:hypothetical protein